MSIWKYQHDYYPSGSTSLDQIDRMNEGDEDYEVEKGYIGERSDIPPGEAAALVVYPGRTHGYHGPPDY